MNIAKKLKNFLVEHSTKNLNSVKNNKMTKKKQVQSVVKLTKALASTSEKTREDAIVDVQLWVENTDFTKLDSTKVEEELKKIWQGLFYCKCFAWSSESQQTDLLSCV